MCFMRLESKLKLFTSSLGWYAMELVFAHHQSCSYQQSPSSQVTSITPACLHLSKSTCWEQCMALPKWVAGLPKKVKLWKQWVVPLKCCYLDQCFLTFFLSRYTLHKHKYFSRHTLKEHFSINIIDFFYFILRGQLIRSFKYFCIVIHKHSN